MLTLGRDCDITKTTLETQGGETVGVVLAVVGRMGAAHTGALRSQPLDFRGIVVRHLAAVCLCLDTIGKEH